MNLKCVGLSKRSQVQKASYGVISFVYLQKKEIIGTEMIETDQRLPGTGDSVRGRPRRDTGIFEMTRVFYILFIVVTMSLPDRVLCKSEFY